MKTNLFTISLLLLFSVPILAQKQEIYINENQTDNKELKRISEKPFEIDVAGFVYYNFRFDLDTLTINIKVERVQRGKVSKKKLNSIKYDITKITGESIPDNNTIVINYYHGLDKCNSTSNKSYVKGLYKNYTRKLKQLDSVSQFFMYKSSEGTKNYGKKISWISDKFGTIEETFLPLNYPCGSYVLIDKDGNYYVQKGEYYILEIIDLLKNKKTTFANNGYK